MIVSQNPLRDVVDYIRVYKNESENYGNIRKFDFFKKRPKVT